LIVHYERQSDLFFGLFKKSDYFLCEDCNAYKTISSYGVKSVEFVLAQANDEGIVEKLVFIEAKKSLREDDTESIAQKFMDSLQLACAIHIGAHKKKSSLPENIRTFFEKGGKIEFLLVIKDCENSSIGRLKRIGEMIKKYLYKEFRIWKFEVKAIE